MRSVGPALASVRERTPAPATPFLKWAGGKRQLLPAIRRFYPAAFHSYAEPFVGSGAVFFDLAAAGRLDGKRVLLLDSNPDLVGCYVAVRDDVETVIEHLRALDEGHRAGGPEFFYAVRDERFNRHRGALLREGTATRAFGADLAAMLIYLNRTCFNGLFRLNAKGEFNTPVGRYANPKICDAGNLRDVSRVLRSLDVDIRCGDFSTVEDFADASTFVYFDPPYAPVSRTSSFTSYTAGKFGEPEQVRLRDLLVRLSGRGARVLLSNSVTPLTTRLYARSRDARALRLEAHRVSARRAINCDGSSRGTVEEYLVTNVGAPPPSGRGARRR